MRLVRRRRFFIELSIISFRWQIQSDGFSSVPPVLELGWWGTFIGSFKSNDDGTGNSIGNTMLVSRQDCVGVRIPDFLWLHIADHPSPLSWVRLHKSMGCVGYHLPYPGFLIRLKKWVCPHHTYTNRHRHVRTFYNMHPVRIKYFHPYNHPTNSQHHPDYRLPVLSGLSRRVSPQSASHLREYGFTIDRWRSLFLIP